MATIVDQLHDEVDTLEEMRERAKGLVISAIRDNLRAALDETGDIGAALVLLAIKAEDDLTDLTTETFKRFAELAQERTPPDA